MGQDTLNKKKGQYYKEGSLIGCCLSGLRPLCATCDKMQVNNKELTRDWIKSKVAKTELYS